MAVSLAFGAALASKLKNSRNIAIAYLGDGACEEGVFHESLNFAKVSNIPILFVVENNLFSSHMHMSLRQPSNTINRFAKANKIKTTDIKKNEITEAKKLYQAVLLAFPKNVRAQKELVTLNYDLLILRKYKQRTKISLLLIL